MANVRDPRLRSGKKAFRSHQQISDQKPTKTVAPAEGCTMALPFQVAHGVLRWITGTISLQLHDWRGTIVMTISLST